MKDRAREAEMNNDGPAKPRRTMMRVLFFGSPDFALPSLRACLETHTVVGVVTQPDRPAGRGQRVTPPPVKRLAEDTGLPVFQPPRLRDPGWAERLASLAPDVGVVVAYGQILPPAILSLPRLGCINLHASLLPRYRGAAPVAWAIVRGETETGLTTLLMDEGMDTGPILCQVRVAIGPEETAGELAARLAQRGNELLVRTLNEWGGGRLTPIPQDGALATFAPRLKKEDGYLSWDRSAPEVVNLIRAMNPWPGAVALWERRRVTFWRARSIEGASFPPGTLFPARGSLAIATGRGAILPIEVHPESRQPISWEAFVRGYRVSSGARFEEVVAGAAR